MSNTKRIIAGTLLALVFATSSFAQAWQLTDASELRLAGTSSVIDSFMAKIGMDKIIEVARSGFTALEK